MVKTSTLKAIKEFTCIGDDCESSCCKQGWRIKIDEEALEIWNRLEASPLKTQLLKHIETKEVDGKKIQSIAYAENGYCFHLTENSQCKIHFELGADSLPNICHAFPRLYFENVSTKINTATMSCPELARLVVENTSQDIFIDGDLDNTNLNKLGAGENALENYLDKWVRLVMRTKHLLSIKLYYIGKIIDDLNTHSESYGLTEQSVIDMCRGYKEELISLKNSISNKKLNTNKVTAGWFWDIISRFCENSYNDLSEYYDLSNPLDSLDTKKKDKHESDFIAIHAEITNLFRQTRPQITNALPGLESYLKTLFINMGFPWNPIGGNFIASYVKTLFHFTSTYYLLAILSKSKEIIDSKDLSRVIYIVERNFFHAPMIANTMKKHHELFQISNYIDCLLDLDKEN